MQHPRPDGHPPSDAPEFFHAAFDSFDAYLAHHLQANQRRRMSYLVLPKEHVKLLREIGYSEKLHAVDEAIRRNAAFLNSVTDAGSRQFLGTDRETANSSAKISSARQPEPSRIPTARTPKDSKLITVTAPDQDKVRNTLQMFVRDWAKEGAVQRGLCYGPILDALEVVFEQVPRKDRARLKVLNPGAGLGRLPLEIAARGFTAQGNELSAHMVIASNYIVNNNIPAGSQKIFPYCHSFSNKVTTADHLLQSVLIPDRSSNDIKFGDDVGGNENSDGPLSFIAGPFERVYGGWQDDGTRSSGADDEVGQWSAVVTCFFIDVSRNILKILDTIHRILKEDGVWINLGPLEWHHPSGSVDAKTGEGSVELSLDEVKALARKMGFQIHAESMIRTGYSGQTQGMSVRLYQAAFWMATKIKT